jgi:hypothetical protein
MFLQIAFVLPLLVVWIGAAPHSSSLVLQGTPSLPHPAEAERESATGSGHSLDGNITSPALLGLGDDRTFAICGKPINAPPYTEWSRGTHRYRPYVDYTYRFQDQQSPRTWTWQLWAGSDGVGNHKYDAEHIYELQLVHWFYDTFLVNRDEVISASQEKDFARRHTWLCKNQITPKIVNSKAWTIAHTFDDFDTPAAKLSAQLSGDLRPDEMVYLIKDINSLKRVFFALYIPRPHNHLEYMLEDLAKVSLLASYLNQEIIYTNFGRVSRRMHEFYRSDVQTAVEQGNWGFGRRLPWGAVYESFEERWLAAIQRNMRKYRDNNLELVQQAIRKRESDTGSSMQWLRDLIQQYQQRNGRLSNDVFSLNRLWKARRNV